MHIQGQLAVPLTPDGCVAPSSNEYLNKIVVAKRGGCTFVQKVAMATAANATALIVVNYEFSQEDQAIFMMGHDPNIPTSKLPAVMVRYKDANEILRQLRAGKQLTASIHRFDLNPSDHDYNRHWLTSNEHKDRKYLWIEGKLSKMLVHTLGGWDLEIAENNGTYQLRLFTSSS
jgi:hypothetical protein